MNSNNHLNYKVSETDESIDIFINTTLNTNIKNIVAANDLIGIGFDVPIYQRMIVCLKDKKLFSTRTFDKGSEDIVYFPRINLASQQKDDLLSLKKQILQALIAPQVSRAPKFTKGK
ncbi:hypothetical protein N9P17_07320 [Tateyamaria sp.]|nr:hypothetical protein [Tateyamaria sp.]